MPQSLDIEQAVLLLEVEPPFDKRDIQLARRRLAKQWHPDIAPPGKQLEHERHLKAVNEAADQLARLAEESRGGTVSRNAVKVAGRGRAQAPRRGGRARLRGGAAPARRAADQRKHDPFASRVPDHSVVHRYARCLSYPEWGVGSVNGIYFTGEGDDIQQWARVSFHVGMRTVPAGSLQFVDFRKPDPGAERVQRFMTAAKHALAEGDFTLAAQRLVYARDADRATPRCCACSRSRSGRPATTRPRRARCATGSARSPSARRRTAPRRASTRTWARSRRRSTRRSARPRWRPATRRRGSASAGCGCAVRPCGCARGARAARTLGAERAGAARPRARRAPDRRRRRRGVGVRAGDAARTGVAPGRGRARPRARAHRPPDGLPGGLRASARARRRPRGPRPARPGARDRAARARRAHRRLTRVRSAIQHRLWLGAQDVTCQPDPACGTSTVVVTSTASRASMRRCSRKSGAAQSSSVRPSSPPSMHAKTPRPPGRGPTSTISPPGASRGGAVAERVGRPDVALGVEAAAVGGEPPARPASCSNKSKVGCRARSAPTPRGRPACRPLATEELRVARGDGVADDQRCRRRG